MKTIEVEKIEIEESDIKPVYFEDFNVSGDIYEFDGYLYGKSKKEQKKWLKTTKKLTDKDIIIWCRNFKGYVDKELKNLESRQNEVLRELKEYIDNKVKKVHGEKK